jgi:UDP-2,3-diacylglucosamine hydrolase
LGKGYIISDLHMMAGYSQWDKHWQLIDNCASKADNFFINGDLYELLFTRYSFKERIENAVNHLESFVKKHPKCQFHYMIGNHENLEEFKEVIKDLERRMPNLAIHDNAFRLGNAVYIHGDQVIEQKEITGSRSFRPKESALTRIARRASLPVVDRFQHSFRVKRKNKNYPNDSDLDFFLDAREKTTPEFRDGVEHYFYGHTHMPKQVENYKDSGISFHNSGAGVEEAVFNILEIDMDGDKVVGVRPVINTDLPSTTSSLAR